MPLEIGLGFLLNSWVLAVFLAFPFSIGLRFFTFSIKYGKE
jgi:hypothetical protein